MSFYIGWIAVVVLATARALVHGEALDAPFRFVGTTSSDSARFDAMVAICSGESDAFRVAVAAIALGGPLATHASDTIQPILVGTAYATDTYEPRLNARLADLDRLPLPAVVRRWEADSSWAFTLCEGLGHELTEAVRYREAWQRLARLRDSIGARGVFVRVIGQAHADALRIEAEIASQQRTRTDEGGRGYARRGYCTDNGAVYMLFGPHTQTFELVDGRLSGIAYNRGADLCGTRYRRRPG